MSEPTAPTPSAPYEIPPDGSLGLLAIGYRGLVAWRAVRGVEWIEEHKKQFEIIKAAQEKAAAAAKAKAEAEGRTVPQQATQAPDAPDAAALEAAEVVVVTGLPRSGTSMLMQMLTAGGLKAFTDTAREADESNPRGYYEHDRVKALAKDKAWVPEADGHVVKVVAPLLPHLPSGPRYRVVFLERDLDEVLRSQTSMLDRLGRPSADPAVLRPVYTRHLKAARTRLADDDRAEALTLDHRDVIADPAGAASQLNAFLGGELDEAAMAAVVDPSLHRER